MKAMSAKLLETLRKTEPTDDDRKQVRIFPLSHNLITLCFRDREGESAFPMHYWIAEEISRGILDTANKLQSLASGTDEERLLARLFARDWITYYGVIIFAASQVRRGIIYTFNRDAFKVALRKSGDVVAMDTRDPLERAVMADAIRWIEEKEAGLEFQEQLQDHAPDGVKKGLGLLRRELEAWKIKNKIMNGDQRDGWHVGRFTVIKWNESIKYPIDGKEETFPINGPKQWQDIEDLMTANGEYVKMRKGFAQRWSSEKWRRLKKEAFQAEAKSPKGTGRYKLLK